MPCDLHKKVERRMKDAFETFGRFIARHPWKVIFIAVFINVCLSLGMLTMKTESGIEQYTPIDSTASQNREQIKSLFSFNTSVNYYRQSLPESGYYGTVIIEREDGGNILDAALLRELKDFYDFINTIVAYDDNGNSFTYTGICAKRLSSCIVEGDLIFNSSFMTDVHDGIVSYPTYTYLGQEVYVDRIIGGIQVSNNVITTAKALKLTFNLESERSSLSRKWELAFIKKVSVNSIAIFSVKYSYSGSLTSEIDKAVTDNFEILVVTLIMMIIFPCLVLMGGTCNCVSNRYNLACAGVLGTGLAIIGSLGFISLCGASFVDIVGAMPFLILGIGVKHMFILLSCLADTSSADDIETRIGQTMRKGGIVITISSITDVIAFCAGAGSVFPSIRNFSLYTGCAILFNYLNYVTFYTGCMTINEQRVSKNRHFCTCLKVESKEQLRFSEASKWKVLCCSGSPHKHKDEMEGPIEKYPKKLVKRVVLFKPTQVVICALFVLYLGLSIWGTASFTNDLYIEDLVGTNSYYYAFYDTDQTSFSQSLTVSLIIQNVVDYKLQSTFDQINLLVSNVRKDSQVLDDFVLSWIHSYRTAAIYDNSSDAAFIGGLQDFLTTTSGNVFINDVVIDTTSNSITASRLHILTASITFPADQADMMVRIRDIVKSSPLNVFAYAPAFVFLEQYVHIVTETVQTLSITVCFVILVIAIFMPLPLAMRALVVLLVTITVVTILLGIVGFVHFWGLTLNSMTMIQIIMCVGFCIDFSSHICHAFIQADVPRNVCVSQALDKAGGPIFNGSIATITGVLVLAFSKSYVFFSFFQVIFLLVIFGLAHAFFLLPVILAYIGPEFKDAMKCCILPSGKVSPKPEPERLSGLPSDDRKRPNLGNPPLNDDIQIYM